MTQTIENTKTRSLEVEQLKAEIRALNFCIRSRDAEVRLVRIELEQRNQKIEAFDWIENHLTRSPHNGLPCPLAAGGAMEALRQACQRHEGSLLAAVNELRSES